MLIDKRWDASREGSVSPVVKAFRKRLRGIRVHTKDTRNADIGFFQRFRSKEILLGFLSARLSHENGTRQLLWSQMAIFVAIVVAMMGLLHWLLGRFLGAVPSGWAICGAILCAVLLIHAAIIVILAICAMMPRYKVVPYSGQKLATWWYHHRRNVESDAALKSRLPRHEAALLLLNLSDVAESIAIQNRNRARKFPIIRTCLVILVALSIVPYLGSFCLGPNDNGVHSVMGKERNGDYEDTEDIVDQFDVPPADVEKASDELDKTFQGEDASESSTQGDT